MTDSVYRNHFTTIIARTLSAVIFISIWILYMTFSNEEELKVEYFLAVVAVLALAVFCVSWRIWKLTTYTFTDSELVVFKNTVWKAKVEIRYDRMASVQVVRGFWNMIFGTSTLKFNVNSAVNSRNAEATLVLRKDLADELRETINNRMFGKFTTSLQEDTDIPSMIRVTNAEVVIHSLLGQPTWSIVFSLLMLLYSVWGLATGSAGNFIIGAAMFVFTMAVPVVKVIIKYGNYRIYRIGDTITVHSGLFVTSRKSFKVGKVNSARMRSPLVPRILGMCTLEAEVVGAMDDMGIPLICPLKKKAVVRDFMKQILPEFYLEEEVIHQGPVTLGIMAVKSVPAAAVWLAASLIIRDVYADDLDSIWLNVILIIGIAGAAVILAYMASRYRVRTFSSGEKLFRITRGGFDIADEYLMYDRVQIAGVSSGPIQRRYGLGTLRIMTLSSVGYRDIRSGIFPMDVIVQVPETVIGRIRDGRYDYRECP